MLPSQHLLQINPSFCFSKGRKEANNQRNMNIHNETSLEYLWCSFNENKEIRPSIH